MFFVAHLRFHNMEVIVLYIQFNRYEVILNLFPLFVYYTKKDVLILVTTYHEMLKDLVDGTYTRRSSSEHKTAVAATGSGTCDGRRRRFDDERQRVISKRRYATKRTLFRLDSSIKNALAQVPPPPPP